MPRNGSGVYSKPPNTTAVPNSTIESSKYNSVIDDLVTDANAARPVVAGGTGASTVSGAQTALSVDGKVVYSAKSANYTALATDNNAVIRFTAAATLSLTAVATLGANWHVTVIADGGDVTIDPDGSETINGAATLFLKDGQAAYIISSGTAFFATITNRFAQAAKGQIFGLTLSNNVSDATNDIDIAAGEAASDGTTAYLMALAASLTKRLDAAWAVGTNQGGLDTESIANNTYHVWIIQRSDTGVVDALFSTSATSPTMPTNYDRKRRIGSIRRESGAIAAFIQDGDFFQWMTPTADVVTISTTATLRTLRVPTGFPVMARIGFTISNASTVMAAVNHWDPAIGSTLPISQLGIFQVFVNTVVAQSASTVQDVRTNSSGQIYAAAGSTSLTSYAVTTQGYFDRRGRY